MIRIIKPTQPPDVLLERGAQRREADCTISDSGATTFAFDEKIYGHRSVKDALIQAQHSKCCFCESKVGRDGDVEHFRPKAGYRQKRGGQLIRPGYYWLAYDWDNLFLSCSACNQRFKGNLFPLVKPSQRANSHHDDLTREQPLFVHPGQEEPEHYIEFREEVAYPVRNNKRGAKTIEALDLNRSILKERRRMLLEALSLVQTLAELTPPDADREDVIRARAYLEKVVSDSSEFASLARCAAKKNFRYLPPELTDEQE